jgi:hypothetical protein
MGAGGMFAATETFGVTNLTAGRGTNIIVANDSADAVALELVDDSTESIDGETYTFPDGGTETFTITNQSDESLSASSDDLTITLSGSNRDGSGEVTIEGTSRFDSFDFPVTETDDATLTINSNLGSSDSGDFQLGIKDTTESKNGETIDVRDALDVDITVTAEFPNTTLSFTRSITIQDQS